MIILAPISVGELFDKITILEIKMENYTDTSKISHVTTEITELRKLANNIDTDIREEVIKLKEVNKIIWDNEDLARTYGQDKAYDSDFILLASKTYELNARRAKIKQTINIKCNSNIVETKSYTDRDL